MQHRTLSTHYVPVVIASSRLDRANYVTAVVLAEAARAIRNALKLLLRTGARPGCVTSDPPVQQSQFPAEPAGFFTVRRRNSVLATRQTLDYF